MRTHSRAGTLLLALMALHMSGCSGAEPTPGPAVAPVVTDDASANLVATKLAVTPVDAGVPAQATTGSTAQSGPTHAPSSGIVKGVVTDTSGAPVASAAVAVVAGTAPYPEMAAFTAADGSYRWILGPGTYTLEAHREGFATASGEFTLEAGQEVQLDLTLNPE